MYNVSYAYLGEKYNAGQYARKAEAIERMRNLMREGFSAWVEEV